MNTFKNFVALKKPQIEINLENYNKILNYNKNNVIWCENQQKSIDAERAAIEETLLNIQYPYIVPFLLALESKNANKINVAIQNLKEWLDQPLPEEITTFWAKLNNADSMNEEETVDFLLKATTNNMKKIANLIESVITKWNGSKITITPEENKAIEPVYSAEITLTHKNDSGSFLYELNDIPKIYGVLDKCDENFHENKLLQEDFFNLIKEIQNPPSVIKTFYIKTNPKEREFYKKLAKESVLYGTTTLTPGILYENVPENGDVWKIKIDAKYANSAQLPIKYMEFYEK